MLSFAPGSFVALGGNESLTFNASCDWPTSSQTRRFHIVRIIRISHYRNQLVLGHNHRPRGIV